MQMECKECNLKIYDGEHYQLETEIRQGRRGIKCRLGVHKYKFIVSLYENQEPLSVSIFRVCEWCGKGIDYPIAFEPIYSVTRRKIKEDI